MTYQWHQAMCMEVSTDASVNRAPCIFVPVRGTARAWTGRCIQMTHALYKQGGSSATLGASQQPLACLVDPEHQGREEQDGQQV
jgi:hypothetical protein